MDYRDRIISAIADAECKRIVRRTVYQLQRLNGGLSAEPSMRTVWDEICLQMRAGEGPSWWAYEHEINRVIAYHVGELSVPLMQTLWLQTSAGIDWDCGLESDDDTTQEPPVFDDDVVSYIVSAVCSEADACINRRVDRYLENSSGARHELDMDRPSY